MESKMYGTLVHSVYSYAGTAEFRRPFWEESLCFYFVQVELLESEKTGVYSEQLFNHWTFTYAKIPLENLPR